MCLAGWVGGLRRIILLWPPLPRRLFAEMTKQYNNYYQIRAIVSLARGNNIHKKKCVYVVCAAERPPLSTEHSPGDRSSRCFFLFQFSMAKQRQGTGDRISLAVIIIAECGGDLGLDGGAAAVANEKAARITRSCRQ